jgi:hypothetical protein
MRRTQIYIDQKTYQALKQESHIKEKTISDLIRSKIKKNLEQDKNQILNAMNNVFGVWKDKKMNVNSYIRNLRKDREIW